MDADTTKLFDLVEAGDLQGLKDFVEDAEVKKRKRDSLLNAVNEQGCTVLHRAVFFYHPSIIRWLLSSEEGGGRAAGFTNILAKESSGRTTALHLAAQRGHLDCCQALVFGSKIDNGERAELLNAVNWRGWTVLHFAADNNHPSIIRWLLSSEEGGGRAAGFTKVLAKDKDGITALHIAGRQGLLECCRALPEGCKIDNGERAELMNAVADKYGWTVLHYAAYNNHQSITKWVLSSDEGGGRAAGFISVLAKDKEGITALHFAAERGHLKCCQILVCGSDVENGERADLLNAVDAEGKTVLHLAVFYNHQSIIKWVLSSEEGGGRAAGFINILAKDSSGSTVLHLAARQGYLECCQALVYGSKIENGERAELLNAVDNDGGTVLHLTAGCRPDIAKWLLSSEEGGGRAAGFTSKSITATTISTSESALHYVAANGTVKCLNALLSGCTVGERLTLFLQVDKHGWTALHEAALWCNFDIIRELLLHYPETQTIVDHRDHRGMTALHRAVIGGVDEESREEWRGKWSLFGNNGKAAVVTALLTTPKHVDKKGGEQQEESKVEDEAHQQQAAMVDPNLGTKIE